MSRESEYSIVSHLLVGLAHLPSGLLYVISSLAYYIVYYIVGYRKKVVRENLELVFSDWDRKRLRRTEREFYRHLCDCIVETVKLLHISDEEVDRRVEVLDSELVDESVRAGHSVVLFLGHYGNWEWVQAIAHHFTEPVVAGQIYKPLKDKVMDSVMLRIRSRFGLECIPQKRAVRRLLEVKNSGQKFVIGFISDQRPSRGSVRYWTTFMGQETPYSVGGETIGEHTDARYLYMDVEKTRRGHYRLTFRPVVPDPEDKEVFPYTREFLKMLEATIRKAPAYWLWSHRLWLYRKADFPHSH